MAELASMRRAGSDVRFGSKADIRAAKSHVCFPPKADMCGATGNVRYGPIADTRSLSGRIARHYRTANCKMDYYLTSFSFSMTSSKLKLAAFCRCGKSRKVAKNWPT
jgi:hypothetical protein